MALYQDRNKVDHFADAAFDAIHNPGVEAPFAGIYRCTVCGHEVGIAQGHRLPPQLHAQHPANVPIRWQLLVFAQHNPSK